MTEQLHSDFSLSCIGEGNGNPLQCSCLENPRDGGAWWAAVYGVAQGQTRLKWLSSSSSILQFPECLYLNENISNHLLVSFVPGAEVIPTSMTEIFVIYVFMEGESQRWRGWSNWRCTISQLLSAGVGFDPWFWLILWPMPCALMLSTYLLFTDPQVFGFHNCCFQVTSPCHSFFSQHAMRKSVYSREKMSSGHRLGLNPSCVKVQVAQSCPTLCNPQIIVHGILQARILEWVAFPFSRGSSQSRDWSRVSHITGRFFTSWDTREAREYWSG